MGGASPINDQNRALVAELEKVVDLPVYWGNRNWHPFLEETVAQMKADGIRKAAAFATAATGLLFELPAVPRGHRPRRRGGAGRARADQDAPLLRPPRVRRGHGRPHPRGDRRGGRRRPAGVHRPLDPGVDGGTAGPDGRRLRAPAPRGLRAGGGRGRGERLRPGVAEPQRPAADPVAGARRLRPPGDPPRQGRRVGRAGADRVRLRPHGGPLRPRRRGARARRRARDADGPRGHGGHPPEVRPDDPRAGRRARADRLPGDLLPGPGPADVRGTPGRRPRRVPAPCRRSPTSGCRPRPPCAGASPPLAAPVWHR